MQRTIVYVVIALAVLVAGFFALNSYIYNEKQADPADDPTINVGGTVETSLGQTAGEESNDGF